MKCLKMLGLAAIIAAGLIAFLGASRASATTLCRNTPPAGTHCESGSDVAKGTELDFSIDPKASVILTDPFGGVIDTCTTSTVAGATGNTGTTTEPVAGAIGTLTFGTVATPCTRTVTVVAKGSLEVHHIAGTDNGTVTSSGTTVIIHNVPLFGECQYSTSATDIGTLTGTGTTGGAPTFDISATITSENGCPKGAWEGSYVYTGSTNFNVAAGSAPLPTGSALCRNTPPAGTHCESGSDVAKGTELDFSIDPKASVILTDPFGGVIDTCTTSTVAGATGNTGTTTEPVAGAIGTLTFGTVATPCTRTVTVVAKGSLEVHHIAGTDNGTVTSSGTTVIIHNVPLFGECQYSTSATDIGTLTGTGTTGGAPTFDISATITSENGCPKGAWEGSYVYTGSTNFNVAAG
jgi:hypothetical protein